MKFINYLESISGIGIYPLISLIVFVGFFALVTLYVIKGNKNHFEKLRNLPLNEKN
ncbi:MAG: CcoQ/FixQ family Cbb3-type cytochrome c oxidase assembly chaperone [Bacteroidota bacterium]|nr:CcoQ/FixQ family Cbb3-type cytochrome c oxidase assembly chaperone [Bacteroidota bacterium]